jgi:hypothetical protein
MNGEIELSAEQVRALEVRQAAAELPAPGPLLDALLPDEAKAAGMELRPIVGSHLVVLQKLGLEIVQTGTTKDLSEMFELVFIFTRPIGEVRAALKQGRESFMEAAMAAIGDKIPMHLVKQCGEAVCAHFLKATATAQRYGNPPAADGSFQTPPLAPATGSAGG